MNQTFTNFELIIINDGTTDYSEDIIFSYQDRRIYYLKNEHNKGICITLNRGLDNARGKYIARMDADDIALPERLQVQYDYMEQHKEYAWCGCNTRLFDENGVWGERKMPELQSDKDYLP